MIFGVNWEEFGIFVNGGDDRSTIYMKERSAYLSLFCHFFMEKNEDNKDFGRSHLSLSMTRG